MANVLVNDASLTAIGNSIRGKNGTQDTYTPAEMASAIDAIPSGGGVPQKYYLPDYVFTYTANQKTVVIPEHQINFKPNDITKNYNKIKFQVRYDLKDGARFRINSIDIGGKIVATSDYSSGNYSATVQVDEQVDFTKDVKLRTILKEAPDHSTNYISSFIYLENIELYRE